MTGRRSAVAGIDLGGTRIKAALVARDGTQLATLTCPTPDDLASPGALVTAMAQVFADLVALHAGVQVLACGVVVPGIVDGARGEAVYSSNLGWRDLPLAQPLQARLGLPVALGHDVRAGLRAEVEWGAAQGSRHVLFLPLGTGIAGALMLDGHLVDADGWSGEVGHVMVDPDGPVCGCGGRGHLEAIASASAIARAYAAMRPEESAAADAKAVADLVALGDPIATAVWGDAIRALARVVVMMTTATGINHVVIGGGLSESGDLLLEPLRAAVLESLTFQRPPRIERAQLGDRAGSMGSAALAWDLV